MKVSISYSEIWRISWPIMLSSMANTVINFTDVAFVSRIGEKELAASALGGIFYFLLVMISVAIGIGTQILIARRAGEDRHAEIGTVFDNGFLMLMVFAVLMSGLLYLFVPGLIPLIVDDPEVATAVVDYLYARGWGLIFMTGLVALRSLYTGITMTRIITYTTVVMMVLNVILNYAFVIGGMGVEPMGIFGSGLASAISETVAALYAVVYTLSRSILKEFQLFKFRTISRKEMAQIFSLSAPIVLQHVLSMGSWFLFFVFIEKLGSRDLAVSNVVRSIYMVLMTPIWGFAQTSNSMVSNIIGQDKMQEVLALVKKITIMSLAIGLMGIVAGIAGRELLFSLSSADTQLMEEAVSSFYMVCLATFFFSVSMVFLSAVSGTGSTTAAMLIEVVCLVVYVLYAYIFTLVWQQPLEIVWIAEVIYWVMMGVISYAYLKSGKWKVNAVRYN
jgi:putative MATE family efflux protein